MRLFSRRGGERPKTVVTEEMDVRETSPPDAIVDSGSYDIPRATMPVELVKARIATRQEWVRAILAIAFVVLLGLVVVLSFSQTRNWADTVDLLDRMLPAVTGLLGSVVGFYFASRDSS